MLLQCAKPRLCGIRDLATRRKLTSPPLSPTNPPGRYVMLDTGCCKLLQHPRWHTRVYPVRYRACQGGRQRHHRGSSPVPSLLRLLLLLLLLLLHPARWWLSPAATYGSGCQHPSTALMLPYGCPSTAPLVRNGASRHSAGKPAQTNDPLWACRGALAGHAVQQRPARAADGDAAGW